MVHNLLVYLQVDKSLSFLNGYVQESIEKGAQPYVSENQRSGAPSISNFGSQTQHEPSTHGLRFEAYELPKPLEQPKPTPVSSYVPSTELVSLPEPSYVRETQQSYSARTSADSGSKEIKLRLDGVQKKWGRPNYSSPPSTSNSSSQNATNGVAQHDTSGTSSKPRDSSYSYKKQPVEIDPEKQKLAASLFGGISKAEKRPSSTSHKTSKAYGHVVEKSRETKPVLELAPSPPPPDLLDLGGPDNVDGSSVSDPFTQLEGLLEVGPGALSANISGSVSSAKDSDLMSLYGDIPTSTQLSFVDTLGKDDKLLFGSANDTGSNGHTLQSQGSKGPNLKEALQKDALVRQMGVTPTSQNPNLFKDLFG